jgi:hypothetical protein
VYDNSAANLANPDATRQVPWGLQSYDEMLYGGFFFRWENGTSEKPVHDELNFQIAQFYGALDNDFSGTLTPNEMPEWLLKPFKAGKLAAFDVNADNALSHPEYRAFTDYRRAQSVKRRNSEEQSQTGGN